MFSFRKKLSFREAILHRANDRLKRQSYDFDPKNVLRAEQQERGISRTLRATAAE